MMLKLVLSYIFISLGIGFTIIALAALVMPKDDFITWSALFGLAGGVIGVIAAWLIIDKHKIG